jgi:hypothetical protein
MSCLLRCGTLHITVLLNAHVVRRAPLAGGQAKQNARSTALDLLAQGSTHCEHSISRVGCDSQDLAGTRLGRILHSHHPARESGQHRRPRILDE